MACDIWLRRDYLRRHGRTPDEPPCGHDPQLCPPPTDQIGPAMTDPTPAELKLLAAVDRDEVWQSFEGECPAILENAEVGQRVVTAAMDRLETKALVRLRSSRYQLTGTGREALTAAQQDVAS